MRLLIACASDPGHTSLPAQEAYPATEAPTVVLEGLATPVGLAWDGDHLWIAEQGAGCVTPWPADEVRICDLDAPTWLAFEDGVLAFTGGGAAHVPGGTVEATSPGRVRLVDGVAYWVDEAGGVYADTTLLGEFDTPRGIAVVDGEVRVADASGLATLDGRLLETGWPGRDLSEDGDVLLTRDDAWPGGGWLYDDDGTALSSSPPWAERVAADASDVYWSARQGITRVPREGGTYTVAVADTAVGDLLIVDGSLWWTDPQRGVLATLARLD
ncbi:MAG: hypothetical protein ACOZNI_23405 [Myxococcota bacterium]